MKTNLKKILLICCLFFNMICLSGPFSFAVKTMGLAGSVYLVQEYCKVCNLLNQYKNPEKYGNPIKYCFRTNECIVRTKIISKTEQFDDSLNFSIKKFDKNSILERESVQKLVSFNIDAALSFSSELIVQAPDGTICGYIDFNRHNKDEVYIAYLVVHPNYRRKGIAKKLIQHVERINKNQANKLKLYVSLENVSAMKLYDSLGFY